MLLVFLGIVLSYNVAHFNFLANSSPNQSHNSLTMPHPRAPLVFFKNNCFIRVAFVTTYHCMHITAFQNSNSFSLSRDKLKSTW